VGLGKEAGIQGLCLMGQTSSKLVIADHQSAQKVLELLTQKFGFKVSVKEIAVEAKKMEKAFVDLQAQLAEQKASEKPSDEFKKYTR
ncbi:hypothetical protein HZB89_01550, partial [archaeon]|nr:hypothetical protein [archaeon]